ncbi:MAG: MoaD/ThiS family protein [Candidatus Methanofastidiosum sp.]|nr:MoaD/ThiS family protein [Methanofastidiosum sp.]
MIKVKLYAEYRDIIGKNEIEIQCDQMTFKEIVEYISTTYNKEFIKAAIQNGKINEYMLAMVGETMLNSIDDTIKDGETLKILATAHGG